MEGCGRDLSPLQELLRIGGEELGGSWGRVWRRISFLFFGLGVSGFVRGERT